MYVCRATVDKQIHNTLQTKHDTIYAYGGMHASVCTDGVIQIYAR